MESYHRYQKASSTGSSSPVWGELPSQCNQHPTSVNQWISNGTWAPHERQAGPGAPAPLRASSHLCATRMLLVRTCGSRAGPGNCSGCDVVHYNRPCHPAPGDYWNAPLLILCGVAPLLGVLRSAERQSPASKSAPVEQGSLHCDGNPYGTDGFPVKLSATCVCNSFPDCRLGRDGAGRLR